MKRYMLDTNTISHLLKQHPSVVRHVLALPMASLCISAITEGELLFGLAKRPEAKRLQLAVKEFLRRVEVLPWDSTVSQQYGSVRAELASQGRTLAPLDLRIASHALSINATLVTNDQAFAQLPHLHLEDWTQPS
jgi:tRNA(fMet)-specific endonuclease VapC